MTLKIGFIGVGGIAQMHLRNLSKMNGVKIAGVFDVLRTQAQEVAARYGASEYASATEMLDTVHPDAVYVCVPPFAHGEAEVAVVERGIPLFVEKPVASGLEPAESILNLVEKKRVLTCVGYHWRYAKSTAFALEALSGHVTGMVQGYWLGDMPMVSWWRNYIASLLDVIRFWFHREGDSREAFRWDFDVLLQ